MAEQTQDESQNGLDRAHARAVLNESERVSREINKTLARSRVVQERAIPVLKRAGYLRRG